MKLGHMEKMIKFIIRILLSALAIMYVLPVLRGVQFHGDFLIACGLGIFFSILLALVEVVAAFLSTIWTLSTFGLALLFLIPMRLFCFWVLPTVSLLLMAHFLPKVLSISNWFSAGIAAVILLIIGLITRDGKN